MNRTKASVLIPVFAVILSGCASPKPIRYFTIQPSTAPMIPGEARTVSLLVAGINSSEIFRETPMAYRMGTNEIGTYQYSRWAEPPVEMIQDSLIRLLRSSGNYTSVASLGSTSDGQFVVRGRLYDFEEVDGASISTIESPGK